MSCFQCDLDIPHVCYEGMREARWGLTEEMAAVLESMQRHMSMNESRARQRSTVKKRRAR